MRVRYFVFAFAAGVHGQLLRLGLPVFVGAAIVSAVLGDVINAKKGGRVISGFLLGGLFGSAGLFLHRLAPGARNVRRGNDSCRMLEATAALGYQMPGRVSRTAPPISAEARWYPDPTRRHQMRYHDGIRFTAHVMDEGVRGVDGTPPPT